MMQQVDEREGGWGEHLSMIKQVDETLRERVGGAGI